MEKEYERFSLNVRIQHIILTVLFILLAVTGLCLTFANSWLAQTLVKMMGGWEMRAHIHHVAGVLLLILGIYHIIYVFLLRKRSKKKLKMWPSRKDVGDFVQYLKYILGFGSEPEYDRYSWKEKFEYWGVVWGVLIMGITGLILLFPFMFIKVMPLGWIHISRLIHLYEAILATLVILIWHFYNVHFHPKWVLQKTFLNGKISEKHIREHHPLEYEELKKSEAKP